MPDENILKGLKQEVRGLKDPGTVLIITYISIILFLLLFAGLESVRADISGTEEKTLTRVDVHRGEPLLIPRAHEEGRKVTAPLSSEIMKTSVSGMTDKTTIPSKVVMVLGFILLLLALLLAKDGKG